MAINKICSVVGLNLVENDKRVIYQDYILDNHFLKIQDFLAVQYFVDVIGQYNFRNIREQTYFFSRTEINDTNEHIEKANLDISVLQELCHFLWFIKDNACNILTHFTYLSGSPDGVVVLDRSSDYNTCFGKVTPTSFTSDEIVRATDILFKAHELSDSNKTRDFAESFKLDEIAPAGGTTHSSINKVHYGLRNRVERAILFLGTMRSTGLIPHKISLGMNILECLFSDKSAGDIIHKIAERVALYIGETKEERQVYFKLVKEAYGIRSKFFHGQRLEPKDYSHEKLEQYSLRVDDLMRLILTKVIMVDGEIFANEKDLTIWFSDMIFTKETVCPKYIFK